MRWSIPTDKLIGPRRLGGRVSRRGYAFQDAYTCLQLSRLLDDSVDIVSIRPEGAQDVDLLYSDGHEEYIQVKDSPDLRYTLAELRPILQSFAIDFVEAGGSPRIIFTLIARSNNIDKAVTRLRNGKPKPEDINEVAGFISQASPNTLAHQYFANLSDAEMYNLSAQLLQQTKFSFGMGDEFEGRLSFESHACSEIAKLGVDGIKLRDAFGVLKDALNIQREFTRADVEELLKRFIGGTAVDMFEGRVETLTDELLSRPANPERIQEFYAGAPLGWDIISAHGDIDRDQVEDLIDKLRQPSETLRLVCIVAEPGAGKSTLARRVAAELHNRFNSFFIRIKSKEDAEVWFRMPAFCEKVKRPFYVLIDDVFRDQDVVSALCDLDHDLPITILATSRSNEYRSIRIKGKFESVPLNEPSSAEKERILLKLGKTRIDLTQEQELRMDNANQLIVLMMELKDPMGRRLEEIVQESIEWLQINDKYAYRAYEYLCFSYQYGMSIPASLLEHLDPDGRFYDLPNPKRHPKAQGLIFYDEDRTGNIRVGHPVIAKIACSFFGRAPSLILSEILAAIDVSNYIERRFEAHLLRVLAQNESSILISSFPRIEPFIASCRRYATISELIIWRSFYSNLGQRERADECVNAALALDPVNSYDCVYFQFLHRELGREGDASPTIAKWIYEHPDDTEVREAYIGLLERNGSSDAIKRGLQETADWLLNHPDDANVRAAYIGLVRRRGTTEQVKDVLLETEIWLTNHQEDKHTRTAHVALIEKSDSNELNDVLIRNTRIWLSKHKQEKEVWKGFISTLAHLGRPEEALEALSEAISYHQDDSNLMNIYINFIQKSADEQTVRKLCNGLIARYPNDHNLLIKFAGCLRDHNQYEESESLYKELILIPKEKTTTKLKTKIHYNYGRLLMELERYLEAVQQFRQTLRLYKGHQMAHSWLATALRALGNSANQEGRLKDADKYFHESEKEFQQAIYLADLKKQPHAIFYTNLGWLYIDWEKYLEAVEAFSLVAKEDPDFFGNYWGLGRAQMALGKFHEAESALCKALENAPENLQPPASVELPELLQQCKDKLN